MADGNRYGRVRYFGYKPSVYTPVFSDINSYVPQSGYVSNSSSTARRYPKPVTATSVVKPWSNKVPVNDVIDTTGESAASTTKPLKQDSSKTADFRDQRTLSVSSGEVLHNSSDKKRPEKRRHHSSSIPTVQEDVPEPKKARRNYFTSATNAARPMRFRPLEAEPPVFTLETLTMEIQDECQKHVQTQATLQQKLNLKAFLEQSFATTFPGCSLHLTGSSNNGFGGDKSDADFCFIFNALNQVTVRAEALKVLWGMQRMLHRDPTFCFLRKIEVIPASVPILKFLDIRSGFECDINVNNTVGVRNTHLLRAYCGVDYRVQPLVVLVKRWANKHGINDASQGTLSSYALTLMVIHYLQGVCKPAVVPVLQRKYPKLFGYNGDMSDLSNEDPCKHMDCNQSDNKQSLGELFVGFFKYYAQDFSWKYYISIAMGGAFPRFGGQWQKKHICIEEPFDGNNVAKAVCSLDLFNKIQMKFRLAWHTLKISPSLESIKVR